MTSAPKSDRIVAAPGPAIKLARSTTFKPEKMFASAIMSPCHVIEPERNELLRFVPHYFGAALTTLEFRRTLCQERGRTILLVFGPYADPTSRRLDQQALRHACIPPFVHIIDRELHAERSIGIDLIQDGFRSRDQVGARHYLIHQAGSICLLSANDFARENQL